MESRLGVSLESERGLVGLELTDAIGLALRQNPRRAHLLVSRLLGKHVPTDPRLVYGAGRLLGVLVADALTGGPAPDRAAAGALLRRCLARQEHGDGAAAARRLLAYARAATRPGPPDRSAGPRRHGLVTVLGYAETATALGHAVADSLGATYVHSTRRPVPGAGSLPGFCEDHSHAQEHLLLPERPELFTEADVLVLVDDEFSTGRTVLNTLRALRRVAAPRRYVLASLVDVRSPADRDRLREAVRTLGAEVDVVSLATGHLRVPADLPETANRLMAELGRQKQAGGGGQVGDATALVRRILPERWPPAVRDGGRHGFSPRHHDRLRAEMRRLAARVGEGIGGPDVLVLGFEELLYAPQLLAIELAEGLGPGVRVRSSSTTRSPVLPLDDPAYAVRTRLTFTSCDDPADGPGPRFAYNVAPCGARPRPRFDDIVLVVDDRADTSALTADGGLVRALRTCCARVHLVRLPSYRPGGSPSRPAGN